MTMKSEKLAAREALDSGGVPKSRQKSFSITI